MTTHFHLLFRIEKRTLEQRFQATSDSIRALYNRRHGRRGVVWHEAIPSTDASESDWHLLEAIRYIALNAPRAGMVEAAEDWPWCSYGSAIGVLLARIRSSTRATLLRLFRT